MVLATPRWLYLAGARGRSSYEFPLSVLHSSTPHLTSAEHPATYKHVARVVANQRDLIEIVHSLSSTTSERESARIRQVQCISLLPRPSTHDVPVAKHFLS